MKRTTAHSKIAQFFILNRVKSDSETSSNLQTDASLTNVSDSFDSALFVELDSSTLIADGYHASLPYDNNASEQAIPSSSRPITIVSYTKANQPDASEIPPKLKKSQVIRFQNK